MSSLRFTRAGRSVTVSREAAREQVVSEVMRALAPTRGPQTVVAFEADDGLVGRIRDGGGPRESYVVDYDAPNEKWGAITDTMEAALTALLEQLESEDPPDSAR
jgi:hypothetical protein